MERQTRQRQAIRDAFERNPHPMSPQEILVIAQDLVPGIGIATVYRNIRMLEEAGTIHAVGVPNEAPRYELAEKLHHHHFRCRSCDRVFDVEGCVDGLKAMLPEGFTLEDHYLLLYGRCDACRR